MSTADTHATSTPPQLIPRTELVDEFTGQRGRWIVPAGAPAWTGALVSEWELARAGWEDQHPHTETNVVLEGELHVETGGTTGVARTGDAVRGPAGQIGRYWAPAYARMIVVQDPNPDGHPDAFEGRHWDIED